MARLMKMKGDTALGLPQHAPLARGEVRQIPVPAVARVLSTLWQVEYADAFLMDTAGARDRTAEQWARAILEEAPSAVRGTLLSGWSTLGLRLGFDQPDRFVLGWEIRRRTPEFVLLAAGSRIGMPAELLFKRFPGTLLFATFVQKENAIARATWAGADLVHRRVVRRLLEQAGSRCRAESDT